MIAALESKPTFPETRWSLVGRVHLPGKAGVLAMGELCKNYWFPVYSYLRGMGCSVHDAEDVTQGFFAQQIEDGLFHKAREGRGRLRGLLFTALRFYHYREYASAKAWKRGGRAVIVSFDADAAEWHFAQALCEERDPEKLYYAAWARGLAAHTLERLAKREAFNTPPIVAMAEELVPYADPLSPTPPYAEIADRLEVTEVALRKYMQRLRHRFAELLRYEVSKTVGADEDVEEELRWVVSLLHPNSGGE